MKSLQKQIQSQSPTTKNMNRMKTDWRFRTWGHKDIDTTKENSIQEFLNSCSDDGFLTVDINCFENRTTIWAARNTVHELDK